MNILAEFFYAAVLGFFSQNLSFELGIGTGNLFKLSADKSVRRRYFFIIMLATTLIAALLTYLIDVLWLSVFVSDYMRDCLRALTFVAVIALLEILFELAVGYALPKVREKMGDYLPSACMNSAVLAILLLNRQFEYGLLQSVLFAVMAVLGFWASVLLMQLLRERVELVRCPEAMKGVPLTFLAASILSLAFEGLTNMNFPY